MSRRISPLVAALLFAAPAWSAPAPLPKVVDFNRDIKPILSDNCFACHGPDKNQRKGDLRLDTRDGLFGGTADAPVVPGKLDKSELYKRLTETDEDRRMPKKSFGKHLTPRQIALIKLWIEQGAEWKGHWAYIKPVRPALPPFEAQGARNAIDQFIQAKLKEHELSPAPEADRITLIRRLSFDLIGLPPTRAEIDAFVNDKSPEAYQKLVDRLLDSPHYGERMATHWLDLVRYADSIGYHSDNPMNVSPYRDYVIRAFNTNKRFDRFTLEQIAGDLLPDATLETRVGSAYNRLLQTTEEGGAQAKEYLAKYDADRVRNVSSVWLGQTMGCCQCHDHKFDPLTMKDFYSLAAFFADIKEAPVGRREPGIPVPSAEEQRELKKLDAEIEKLRKALAAPSPEIDAAQKAWEKQAADMKNLPAKVRSALTAAADKRTDAQKKEIADYYRTIAPALAEVRSDLAAFEQRKAVVVKDTPMVLVSVSVAPRTIRIYKRGNWLDDTGPIVTPAVPAVLPQPKFDGPRGTRLDLAKWLVSHENPLTARAFVNRLWKMYFGTGLSKSLEDLGSQGELPTHPELLDWLALEFMDSGWDVKHLVKLIVMSGTYRQTSVVARNVNDKDPFNRLLARQSRFRLDAEMVRDNVLALSGLLSPQIGGPSAKPYQPPGYWAALNFPTREWQNDTGLGLYRRGLYTHWQRSFPHPSMIAFDAPSREECIVERSRSNIPQQALVLLNDPTYVEAARVFAERIMKEGGKTPEERAAWALQEAVSRPATEAEVKVLAGLYARHVKQFATDRDSATKLLATGARPAAKDLDSAELAAWTSVARAVLNLHEVITRQ